VVLCVSQLYTCYPNYIHACTCTRYLYAPTDTHTFPQCFINGKFFGGAADACIKFKKGELQPLLEEAGFEKATFEAYKGDPFEFLPKWMSQNPLRSK